MSSGAARTIVGLCASLAAKKLRSERVTGVPASVSRTQGLRDFLGVFNGAGDPAFTHVVCRSHLNHECTAIINHGCKLPRVVGGGNDRSHCVQDSGREPFIR